VFELITLAAWPVLHSNAQLFVTIETTVSRSKFEWCHDLASNFYLFSDFPYTIALLSYCLWHWMVLLCADVPIKELLTP